MGGEFLAQAHPIRSRELRHQTAEKGAVEKEARNRRGRILQRNYHVDLMQHPFQRRLDHFPRKSNLTNG
jgi:hypothetical protein